MISRRVSIGQWLPKWFQGRNLIEFDHDFQRWTFQTTLGPFQRWFSTEVKVQHPECWADRNLVTCHLLEVGACNMSHLFPSTHSELRWVEPVGPQEARFGHRLNETTSTLNMYSTASASAWPKKKNEVIYRFTMNITIQLWRFFDSTAQCRRPFHLQKFARDSVPWVGAPTTPSTTVRLPLHQAFDPSLISKKEI